jgi:hypothetical protein
VAMSVKWSPRKPWLRLSVAAGNIIQLAGLALGGGALLAASSTPSSLWAILEMSVGWICLYLCCHAIAHWLVGRWFSIRFRYYTIDGTSKPQSWPSGPLRWLFEHIPFFRIHVDRTSLQSVNAGPQAAMWSAGVTASVIVPVLGAFWAWRLHIPGGLYLFIFTVIWSIGTVINNLRPGGDYFKARQVLMTSKPSVNVKSE